MISKINSLFIFICLLVGAKICLGQESKEDFGQINIGVVVPQELEGFSSNHLKKIESKILSLITKTSVSSANAETGIVMYPVISIFQEESINPGLQNIYVVVGELSLFIKQIDDKIVFASTTKKIKGSGRTRELAINNLISTIPTKSEEYGDFISKSRVKIIDYYNSKCNVLLSKADQLSKANQHEQAISMLYSIPAETKCFENVKEKSLEIYRNYQNYICGQWVSKAKSKLANNEYQEGFEYLSKVDPSSSCADEVNKIYKKQAKEVDANVQRYWDFWDKIYTNTIEAEKYRWKAMSEMAVLYLNSQNRRNLDYITIINK